MRILVDADACPVVRIVEKKAERYDIPVVLLCDTNHILQSDYSEVITVGAGADAVDFKLVNICQKGDLVVTQDYGVAAMILGKGAYGGFTRVGDGTQMTTLIRCSWNAVWQKRPETQRRETI